MKDNDDSKEPCCLAEAIRRITRVNAGGIGVGLSMVDQIFGEVAAPGLSSDEQLVRELIRRVRIYNYVPPRAEETYAAAILAEYKKRA